MKLAQGYIVYFLRLFYLQEQKNQLNQEKLLPHLTEKPRSALALDTVWSRGSRYHQSNGSLPVIFLSSGFSPLMIPTWL